MRGANPHQPISCDITQDSATHGTKNIIANRLVAVSERILIGKSGVYTENNNESRIEGSNPSVPMVPS